MLTEHEPEANWPPKSPHEALRSSPSGLKRLQRVRRNDSSPTPSKRRKLDGGFDPFQSETDTEEDEETLKLRLKEIEIRRKLKKIQNAKRKDVDHSLHDDTALNAPCEQSVVEVPHSPKSNRLAQQAPVSPRRVQLGIDKGLKASDVSLRKARSLKVHNGLHPETKPIAKSKSFSERLAELRTQDGQRSEKQRRAETAKSTGFGMKSVARLTSAAGEEQRSRDLLKQSAKPEMKDDNTERGGHGARSTEAIKTIDKGGDNLEHHSGFSLSKRNLDDGILSQVLVGKTVLTIPRLLKDITAPDYDIPDFPTEDFVIMGIIASKSSPRDQQKGEEDTSNASRPKFMALTLTDLEWSIDLYLFDSGFSRFWKLTVGTVIAILNPGIMPPKPHLRDTGRYSLKLSSSEDTVLEIGMSENLGFCSSVKKDGKKCGQWIDKRKTEFCDFHVNLAIEKTTAKRMEINGMSMMGLFDTRKAGTSRGSNGRGSWRGGRGGPGGQTGSRREGEFYDRHLGEKAYIVPPGLIGDRSTAKLLDTEDYVQGSLSSKERSRKRLADRERERELGQKLADAGRGMGSEYMRIRRRAEGLGTGDGSNGIEKWADVEEKKDAAELGLVGLSADKVTLSPVKGGRRREGTGAQPMGWSGAFKRGLLSPSNKKAMPLASAESQRKHSGNASSAKQDQALSSETNEANGTAKETAMRSVSKVTTENDFDDDGLDII